jgi:hypothetical protein
MLAWLLAFAHGGPFAVVYFSICESTREHRRTDGNGFEYTTYCSRGFLRRKEAYAPRRNVAPCAFFGFL